MKHDLHQDELFTIFGGSVPRDAFALFMDENIETDTLRVQLQEIANRIAGDQIKQVIVIRHDLKMRLGKSAAQASHASMEPILKALRSSTYDDRMAFAKSRPDDLSAILPPDFITWMTTGTAKIVARVDSLYDLKEIALQARAVGLPVHIVTDAGRTEFDGPTVTCCAIGPGKASLIDPITGDLKLM
jgi:PTH2 family peptidyl-tRNA hydrolase